MPSFAPGTITSADAVYTIAIAGLYPAPQQLQQWSSEKMFSMGRVSNKELQLGVDGALAAGWIPALKVHDLSFLASSVSIPLFETWGSTEEVQRTSLVASGLVIFPSTGVKYTLVQGYLTDYSPMPDAGRVMGSRGFLITWRQVIPTPF